MRHLALLLALASLSLHAAPQAKEPSASTTQSTPMRLVTQFTQALQKQLLYTDQIIADTSLNTKQKTTSLIAANNTLDLQFRQLRATRKRLTPAEDTTFLIDAAQQLDGRFHDFNKLPHGRLGTAVYDLKRLHRGIEAYTVTPLYPSVDTLQGKFEMTTVQLWAMVDEMEAITNVESAKQAVPKLRQIIAEITPYMDEITFLSKEYVAQHKLQARAVDVTMKYSQLAMIAATKIDGVGAVLATVRND